jgi:hypothetical protein
MRFNMKNMLGRTALANAQVPQLKLSETRRVCVRLLFPARVLRDAGHCGTEGLRHRPLYACAFEVCSRFFHCWPCY